MGIERRGNREYYYKKRKVSRRVVSEYIGGSPFDLTLYEWDRVNSFKEKHKRNLQNADRYEFEKSDRKLDKFEAELDVLTTAFLVNRGFYQTNSREWRYKNDEKEEK